MLSAANLTALDEARLRFIVGARTTRAPGDLEAHFHWEGDAPADGQVIDTITPRRGSRSERDKSLKAEPVWGPGHSPGFVEGGVVLLQAPRGPGQPDPDRPGGPGPGHPSPARSVPRARVLPAIHAGDATLDEASLARARSLVGLKGYVTNIPARLMDASEVISSYHELWHARAVLCG